MPKSRNRSSKAIKHSVFKKLRAITNTLRQVLPAIHELANIGNQHAAVINSQRDKIAKQELRIQLLEEKVYATLTQEERERLADIIDPQPADEPVAAQPSEAPVLDAELVEDAPATENLEPAVEQPAA